MMIDGCCEWDSNLRGGGTGGVLFRHLVEFVDVFGLVSLCFGIFYVKPDAFAQKLARQFGPVNTTPTQFVEQDTTFVISKEM